MRGMTKLHRLQAENTETSVEIVAPEIETAPVAEAASVEAVEMEELSEKEKEILRLKDAEKFIVRQTGQYECRVCAYVYDEGEQGTAWADLSNSWRCPNCLSQKGVFTPKTETIAGFAENQQYGFGTNTMTSGDKNGLIFGGLAAFFLLFLSGYFLE